MDNPEEILHSLEEFAKLKPKDIPRELEEYLSFVAKTGDPVYQWGTIKSLFREKLINVITELYESCPSVEIPPSPNVEVFNYEKMKNFILEKLDTFVAAPFTVQRICELLTTPRKEYNRIDKYMRALEKNILVVSTIEPGNRRAENGEGIVNGVESDHYRDNQANNDINVEDIEMEEAAWPKVEVKMPQIQLVHSMAEENENDLEMKTAEVTCATTNEALPVERALDQQQLYVSIEPVTSDSCLRSDNFQESSVTITAVPAPVQKRRDSIEPVEQVGEDTPLSDTSQMQENKIVTQTTTPEPIEQQHQEIAPVGEVENIHPIPGPSEESKVENTETPESVTNTPTEDITSTTIGQLAVTVTPNQTEKDQDKDDEKETVESEERIGFKSEEVGNEHTYLPLTDTQATSSEESITTIVTEPEESLETKEEIKDSSATEPALEENLEKGPTEKPLPLQRNKSPELESQTSSIDDPASITELSAVESTDAESKVSVMLENEGSGDGEKSSTSDEKMEDKEDKKMEVELEPQKSESNEAKVTTESNS